MARYTITPWRHPSDLLQVRDQLYRTNASTNLDQRRSAVDRIMAWKLRGGNLPHAVDSTALLVDAILHHTASTGQAANNNSAFSTRAVYSAAFTRFVTGFCDIGRAKERALEPSSMLAIARQIGMPGEFVALRHEATHEELPGLRRLIAATEQALEWLWKVYWSRLEGPEGPVKLDAEAVREEARKILRTFRSQRRETLRSKKQSGTSSPEVNYARDACVMLCDRDLEKLGLLAGVLVDDRLLIPSGRALGSSLEGAFLIWDNLLRLVGERYREFFPMLAKTMLESLSEHSPSQEYDAGEEAIHTWLVHLRLLGRTAEDDFLAPMIIKWCCLHPGHWSQQLGEAVLEDCDPEFEGEWADLFAASKIGSTFPFAESSERQEEMIEKISNGQLADPGGLPDISDDLRGWRRAALRPTVPIGVVQ